MNRRSFIGSAGALACAYVGGCASPVEAPPASGAAAVQAPALRSAQFWEYAVQDGYTGVDRGLVRYTIAQVDAQAVVVNVERDGQRIDTYRYASGWNGLEIPITNLQRFRFEPPFPALEFPLFAGQSWRRVVRATDPARGRTYRMHVHANVGGWHRLRVPAGEFDAIQVRRYVYAGNAEYFKLQEEIVQTDWYAPAVGFVAMSEDNSSHIDTSRSGGGRGRPLRVRGDWLVERLTRYSFQ